ncbi:MAG: twin-arginine translocase subunit TatC [Alphaproteobacteria bacterium]|nr:twin-arginine translocase subunit TatC [Alphaproteobacteria bacterium]MDA7986914.1 twin-arginine translocase subunit TatC [Alphaproteobacteria bacterium]MDA7999782.1 twin-arginine translocase subunit TatC [Alphaproteobacteria bacterium]MDA8003370.1 twin-arginine translocase subunit TatC [Alphaproteobacteria bacterium]MDA8005118.1 twin-arginine translocase subunit TatC [Alphaproteobacteria bacterium]
MTLSTPDIPEDDEPQSILAHLVELRQRLMWCCLILLTCFVAAFFFASHLYNFLAHPLAEILLERQTDGGQNPRMIFTSLTEPFFAHVKVAFFFALFVSTPVILTQIWLFIAPGLYRKERKAVAPFLIASPLLFLLGAWLVWQLILPLAWRFFLQFENPGGAGTLPIELEAKVGEYLTLTMQLIFAFGLAFQLPVLMTLLVRAGILTADALAERRRWAILGAFVFAAVFTPPDPVSQLSLAVPLVLLYEISIRAARYIERRHSRNQT